MRLQHLTDETLLAETESLARKERELLGAILHHLREIERRRLFSALGYSSLFTYAVHRLGYPEDQAQRRISAMRLLRELPEMEEKIQSGSLSLTHLGMAKAAFQRERFTREEKLEILSEIESKPTREAEKVLAAHAPLAMRPDSVRAVNKEQVELRFSADAALLEKIEALKGLLAHQSPNLSLGELFQKLCDLGLEAWDKAKSPAAPRVDSQAEVRRQVWRKARGRCERCRSHHALEIDHIRPKARGGDSSPGNLRLLCRSCNQRAAVEAFGAGKMETYFARDG